MLKKEVKILGLSYSQSSSGAYIVVLSEKNGNRKLPIIIKPSDAQQIALKIEGAKSSRPLTHELFKILTDYYKISIKEVFIYSILEGVFHTKIITTNINNEEVSIECSAGDGISLSIVYDCPLYVSKEVLDISGVYINDDGTNPEEEGDDDISYYDYENEDINNIENTISIEDLEFMMQDAIKNEEYEIAARIRDQIDEIKTKYDKK